MKARKKASKKRTPRRSEKARKTATKGLAVRRPMKAPDPAPASPSDPILSPADSPELKRDLEDALDQFAMRNDPGALLELLRRTLQYCQAPYDVQNIVREAGERWRSGRRDPTDSRSPIVRTLGHAFALSEGKRTGTSRPARYKPETRDLRGGTDPRSFAWKAYQTVEKLRSEGKEKGLKRGMALHTHTRPNLFSRAALLLPLDSKGTLTSDKTIERLYHDVRRFREGQASA